MKKFTFELVIEEGCDEFWESLNDKSGCDEVSEGVQAALNEHGFIGVNLGETLILKKFENVSEGN